MFPMRSQRHSKGSQCHLRGVSKRRWDHMIPREIPWDLMKTFLTSPGTALTCPLTSLGPPEKRPWDLLKQKLAETPRNAPETHKAVLRTLEPLKPLEATLRLPSTPLSSYVTFWNPLGPSETPLRFPGSPWKLYGTHWNNLKLKYMLIKKIPETSLRLFKIDFPWKFLRLLKVPLRPHWTHPDTCGYAATTLSNLLDVHRKMVPPMNEWILDIVWMAFLAYCMLNLKANQKTSWIGIFGEFVPWCSLLFLNMTYT